VDDPGDSGTVELRGNVRIQNQTAAQGILSEMERLQQLFYRATAISMALIDLPVSPT
jgi:hypothetical protein